MLARLLGGFGRTLMTAGTLILLFVVYQLWGTGIQEARAQDKLGREFEALKAEVEASAATSSTTISTTTAPPDPSEPTTEPPRAEPEVAPANIPLPSVGDPIGKLSIPKIGVTRELVEGANLSQLKRGPAHYEETPLPGQAGNASIAGHRTTYGQPFHNVDKLTVGDLIEVETLQGRFTYEIDQEPFVVYPDDSWVLADTYVGDPKAADIAAGDAERPDHSTTTQPAADLTTTTLSPDGSTPADGATGGLSVTPAKPLVLENRITLTACEPKWSAARRLIVTGVLVGEPVPPIQGQTEARTEALEERAELADDGVVNLDGVAIDGERASKVPVVLWGLACALVWLLTWLVQRWLRKIVARKAAVDAGGSTAGTASFARSANSGSADAPAGHSAGAGRSPDAFDDDIWTSADAPATAGTPATAEAAAFQPTPGALRPPRPRLSLRLLTWTPYLVGLPAFLVVLYVFFENFARLLPASY